jgi:CRISPR/Cas system-associated exonuclease Cas4 (RecB family)
MLEDASNAPPLTLTSDSLIREWNKRLEELESEMSLSAVDRWLVPIELSLPDLVVRQHQTISRALNFNRSNNREAHRIEYDGRSVTGFEVPVSTRDGLVRGRIDRVLDRGDGIVLQDFKTGNIFQVLDNDALLVKPSYSAQLQLYAALYRETFEIWPTTLEVVPLQGEAVRVDLDYRACEDLLKSARDLLAHLNQTIDRARERGNEVLVGTPGEGICKFCSFRPYCREYMSLATRNAFELPEKWPIDLIGTLIAKQRLNNGKLLLSVRKLDKLYMIRGITADGERHPDLYSAALGDQLAFFSLRVPSNSDTYVETMYTTIYALD